MLFVSDKLKLSLCRFGRLHRTAVRLPRVRQCSSQRAISYSPPPQIADDCASRSTTIFVAIEKANSKSALVTLKIWDQERPKVEHGECLHAGEEGELGWIETCSPP